MMKEWKRCAKLLGYSYGLKWNLAIGGACFVAGILIHIFTYSKGVDYSYSAGAMLLTISLFMSVQLKTNMQFSQLVMASGRRKHLEKDFSDMIAIICAVGGYLLQIAMLMISSKELVTPKSFVLSGVAIALVVLFVGFSSKFAVAAIISGFFIYQVIKLFVTVWYDAFFAARIGDNLGSGIAVGGMIIFVAILGDMLLRRVFYKKQISRYSGSAGLQKNMQ